MNLDRAKIGIKICGLNDTEGVDAAAAHGADWIGFVFHPASPRFVTPAQAAALSVRAPQPIAGGPRRVALLVRPDDALIDEVCATLRPDILQLYDEKPRIAAIVARVSVPAWAAVGVAHRADLPRHTSARGLVVEAKPPHDADRPGGNGTRFDWALTKNWSPPVPWLLAGGLTPDNVADALARSGADAVDVSSGVEAMTGRKSPALIAAFINRAREFGRTRR